MAQAGGTNQTLVESVAGNALIIEQSVTIGDYTTPSNATATSTALDVADAIFGTNSDQVIDDFTTYATQGAADAKWVSANTAKSRVNITNDNIAFNFEDNLASDSHIYKDRGSAISDTLWTLRFKIFFTVSDVNSRTWFGIASTNTDQNTAKDFIGVLFHDTAGSAPTFKTADTDGAVLPTAGDNSSAAPLALNTAYYVSIVRTSATAYTVSVYSDSTYDTLIETINGTCAATTVSLRYISFYNRNDFDSSNHQVGTIDNVEFWNGNANPSATFAASKSLDDTAAVFKSKSQIAPAIYFDMGSTVNMVAVAIKKAAGMTATEIKLRCSAITTFDDTNNVRKITVSNLTTDVYAYYIFNIQALRYFQIIGTDAGAKVLSFNEIKIRKVTDAVRELTHGHLVIDANDALLTDDGT